MRVTRDNAINLGLAILGGLMMGWSFGLHPLWWLAWVAPAPLLLAALRSSARAAFGWSLLAGLIAASGAGGVPGAPRDAGDGIAVGGAGLSVAVVRRGHPAGAPAPGR
jgi:hypothetical protein